MQRGAVFCLVVLLSVAVSAQIIPATPTAANTDPAYQALRNLGVGTEAIAVNNVVLKRDAGVFTFASGTICFAQPVEGKVTGAVFVGNGTFEMKPPTAVEQQMLAKLTKEPQIKEDYSELLLRFTDDTHEQLKKAAGGSAGQVTACPAEAFRDNVHTLKKNLVFKWNISARVLEDVYSPEPGGFFMAFIKGKKYGSKLVFEIDPRGIAGSPMPVAPEEVTLFTFEENKFGIWAAFHRASEYASNMASSAEKNRMVAVTAQQLDTSFEKSGKMSSKATTTFVSRYNGVRVVPLELYPTLRVQNVLAPDGEQLKFIQEDKDDDADFAILLPRALNKGESYTVTTVYSGKDALTDEGGGNYYLAGGARDRWYPNSGLDDYASYEMRFTYPKDFKLVATGNLVKEMTEGGRTIAQWNSDQPQTVAAFNIGRFRKQEKQVKEVKVETYANEDIPGMFRGLQMAVSRVNSVAATVPLTIDSINTTSMAQKAMAEAELCTQLYTEYFGPVPFKRLAMTQQTAGNYGQSWPGLVWLPISYFFDDTIRHQLYGWDPKGYFKVVGPHEIAHQWWGHTITWGSYRDQWMSEGFSEMSAALFLQSIDKSAAQFIKFWNDEREMLLEKNVEGWRAIDAGPLTLGYRLQNSKTGSIPRRLIYPKGGYVLHMIRMMMWNPNTGDQRFKETMRDFVKTYYNKPATTEDFKSMIEKHMTSAMNVNGDGKMDWFFDEYVYGTAIPTYHLDYTIDNGAGGMTLNLKITQSNVHDKFRMITPVYLEFANGSVRRFGTMLITGNSTRTETVPLAGMSERPKRVLLNYYNDVLAEMK